MKLVKLCALAALVMTIGTTQALAEHHEGHSKKDGSMFEKIDTNKDGVVTKEETSAFHDAKFAEMDSNKDGKVTKEEAKVFKDARKAEWKAKIDAATSK